MPSLSTRPNALRFILALTAGLGLSACLDAESTTELDLPADAELDLPSDAELDASPGSPMQPESGLLPPPPEFMTCTPGEGIDTGQVTARLPDGPNIPDTCSLGAIGLPKGWTSEPLFKAIQGLSVPDGLEPYCLYSYQGVSPSADAYTRLYHRLDQVPGMAKTAAVDCVALSGMSGLDGDAHIDAGLYQAFRNNIAAIDSLAGAQLDAVGVYVVDQIAEWEFGSSTPHEHGHNMGYIVRDVLCPDADSDYCDAHLHFEAGLIRTSDGAIDPGIGGGHVGSHVDISRAIYRAIMRWRAQAVDPFVDDPERHAVIMGAFGANPTLSVAADRGAAAALREVLDLVACSGGIFVASSGNANDPGCAANDGPLFPAALANEKSPDAGRCAELGVPELGPAFPVSYGDRPLVDAVAMVDAWDRLPALARDKALPDLVTYGTQAWVPNPTGKMRPQTGTSVATAVTAATMALVWAVEPSLSAREVHEVLYETGYATSYQAHYGLAGDIPVRRVSVCSAVAKVCGKDCPSACTGAAAPASDGHRGHYHEAVDTALDAALVNDGGEATLAPPVCLDPPGNVLSEPTPENPACPYCDVDTGIDGVSHALNLDLLEAFKSGPHEVLAGHLLAVDVTGSILGRHELTNAQIAALKAASDPTVTVVHFTQPNLDGGTLVFELANGRTAIGEVIVH